MVAPKKVTPKKVVKSKIKPYIKQFMRGISKINLVTPDLQQSENIWLVSDVDAYLEELNKDGYELIEAFFVYNAEKAYYIHYVMKLRK